MLNSKNTPLVAPGIFIAWSIMNDFKYYAPIAAALAAVTIVICVIYFGLAPSVFVGTLLFICIRKLEKGLPGKVPNKRITGLAIILILVAAMFVILGFVGHSLLGPAGVGGLLLKVSTILDHLRASVPVSWREYIPEGIDQLKDAIADQLKVNAGSLTQMSEHGLHQAAYLFLAVIVAAILGASAPAVPIGLFSAPLYRHISNYTDSMSKVFGAQLKVALINAALTGIFLLVILPLMGVYIPFAYVATLLTFIFGLIPVIGNLLSNSINVLLGLSVAPWVALVCLGF